MAAAAPVAKPEQEEKPGRLAVVGRGLGGTGEGVGVQAVSGLPSRAVSARAGPARPVVYDTSVSPRELRTQNLYQQVATL